MPFSNRFSATNQPRKKKGAKIGRKYKGVSANKKFAAAARVARSPIRVNEDGDIICTLKFKSIIEREARTNTAKRKRKRRASMAVLASSCAGDDGDGDGSTDVIDEQGRRAMIAAYFVLVLKMPAPSPEHGWGGRDGVVSTLVRELDLKPNSHCMVKSVLDDVMWCYLNSVVYDGSRAPRETYSVMVLRARGGRRMGQQQGG